MKLGKTTAPALALAAAAVFAPAANAALGDTLYASGGDIIIRFEGSDAGYSSLISVNGPPEIFPNHSTAVGTEVNLGSFAAGTLLDIMLHVLTTGNVFHTGPGALNIDGLAHANVTYSGGRTYVTFEDIVGGGDRDYNDHMFSFTGVTNTVAAVPEPTSLALTLAGLGVLGFLGARRRKG
jgi:hypothetical protein